MQQFFDELPGEARTSPQAAAEAYGAHLFHPRSRRLIDEKKLARSPFYVGLGVDGRNIEDVTKRATLVTDALLLSHHGCFAPRVHRLRELSRREVVTPIGQVYSGLRQQYGSNGESHRTELAWLSMTCPDIHSLGKWILSAEPLLRAGLSWYLPNYLVTRTNRYRRTPSQFGFTSPGQTDEETESFVAHVDVPSALDFLLVGERVIGVDSSRPQHDIKNAVVRPVLTVDLPFLDGVNLADFSEITVQELDAYAAFRSYLRQSLLDLDPALNANESERELIKIAHRVEDEVRGVQAQMTTVRRRRVVAVTGAVVGTIGATLVAVYGEAFQAAATAMGAAGAGGVWGIIQSAADNSPQQLRDGPWYYVWVLQHRAHS
ncbi:hypothetical protein ABZ839_33420 [Streptomyces cellulosae]